MRLIEAWSTVETTATLLIAGAWDTRYPEPKEKVASLTLNNVRFLGPIADEDLPALYAGAQLFVFPSLYEGFGLPVIEAMACGTAVACSHSSSLPEVAGEAALYFDPENSAEIARQIGRLLQNDELRSKMAQQSLQQAKQFSWTRTAQETLKIYRDAK